jgi:hypothetical protein
VVRAGEVNEVAEEVVKGQLGDRKDGAAVRARELAVVVATGLVQVAQIQEEAPPKQTGCAALLDAHTFTDYVLPWREALPGRAPKDPDPGRYWRDVALDLAATSLLSVAEIAFVLAAVAGLFASAAYQAAEHAGALPPPGEPFEQRILRERACWLLEQPRYFVRRFGLFLLISIGIDYLLAPLGLQASILTDFVRHHPSLGALSRPSFVDYAADASPVAVGFCGFLVYTVLTLLDRWRTGNLDDRIFVSLLIRGIVVLMIGVVLTGMGENGVSRALVFTAGVFPTTAIEEIAKLAKVSAQRITNEEGPGFEVLASINRGKQVILQEMGLSDTSDLACADLGALMLRVSLPPEVLLSAVDEALLFHVLGEDAAKKLQARGIQTATSLVDYARKNRMTEMKDDELTLMMLDAQIDTLESHPNVAYIREARAAQRAARDALDATG